MDQCNSVEWSSKSCDLMESNTYMYKHVSSEFFVIIVIRREQLLIHVACTVSLFSLPAQVFVPMLCFFKAGNRLNLFISMIMSTKLMMNYWM